MIKYKLGDVVKVISERVDNPANCEYDKFVGLEHYVSGEIEIKKYGNTSLLKSAMKVFKSGDILVARRNVYLKRASIVKFDGITSGDSIVLRVEDKLLRRIIPFVLNTDEFWGYAEKFSDGTMSKRLSPKVLLEYEFMLPQIDQQEKLADLLWAVNYTNEAYKKLLHLTDELVKSQFIEMFGDPVTNPNGWAVMKMKDASLRLSDGPFGSNLKSEHYSSEGIRVIRLQNIGSGDFNDDDKAYVSHEHYQKIKKYTCESGDIVIGTLGEPNLRACIIPDSIDIAVNKADCVHYVPKPDILNNVFVCHYINCPSTIIMAQGSVHGNTRQRISSGQVAQLPIFMPPTSLQNQFADFVQQADKSKLNLEQNLVNLEVTLKALMSKSVG
ncbi:EcoKI restriction-modification system protein HsdS [compost metagenome]